MSETGQLTGTVSWFNRERGFGVILGDDLKEYFIHHSNLPDDLKHLTERMKVSFKARSRPHHIGDMEAFDVRLSVARKKKSAPKKIGSAPPARRNTGSKPPKAYTPARKAASKSDMARHPPSIQPSPSTPTSYWYESMKKSAERQPQIGEGYVIRTQVVGVTFEGRQSVVAKLSAGEQLRLVREPFNPYDSNAIRVERESGQQVGYLRRELASRLAPLFDDHGEPVPAEVTEITGGHYPESNLGVNILFRIPGASLHGLDE